MMLCCRFCGAEHSPVNARCWDCKLVSEAPPAISAGEPGEDEVVVYDLFDWPAHARVVLGTTLSDRGIPWHWEPGLSLVVTERDEQVVEEVLDALEDEEFAGAGVPDSEEEAGPFDSEDGQAAMGDLFVAADRLMHEPWDEAVAEDLFQAAGVVDASAPPYGIEGETWVQIRELASMVRADLESVADEEVVVRDARTLREVLRRYI